MLQISGAGHWFLEGWIGDHVVDFLVDSGSAVTALSCKFYQAILGCSSCIVSFLGLRTEFPVLVCDLSTDAIIGTDTLG